MGKACSVLENNDCKTAFLRVTSERAVKSDVSFNVYQNSQAYSPNPEEALCVAFPFLCLFYVI